MFDSSDFNKLLDHVDACSLMTYDYSQSGRYNNNTTICMCVCLAIQSVNSECFPFYPSVTTDQLSSIHPTPYFYPVHSYCTLSLSHPYPPPFLSLSPSFSLIDVQSPGANSPIDWVEEVVLSLSPSVSLARQKILLGLNFYGYDFTGSDMSR